MLHKKSMRVMGVSLAVASMLLSVSAISSLLGASTGFNESGALLSGCKEPCFDSCYVSVTECLHLGGPTCETNACQINTLQYMRCEEGSPGSGKDPCEYVLDGRRWARWEIWREMSCQSTTESVLNFGDSSCAVGRPLSEVSSTAYTPCIIAGCNGPIYDNFDKATLLGAVICKPPWM